MRTNRLATIREINGLTIEAVAEKANVKASELVKLEALDNLDEVTAITLVNLARALNTSVECLMGAQENRFVELLPEYIDARNQFDYYNSSAESAQKALYTEFYSLPEEAVHETTQDILLSTLLDESNVVFNENETKYTTLEEAGERFNTVYERVKFFRENAAKQRSRMTVIEKTCILEDPDSFGFIAKVSPLSK